MEIISISLTISLVDIGVVQSTHEVDMFAAPLAI